MKSFKGNGWTVTTGEKVSVVIHDIRTLPGFHKFHDPEKAGKFFTMNYKLTFAELEKAIADYHEYTCRGNGWIATFDGNHFELRKAKSGELVWQYEDKPYINMTERRKLDIVTLLERNEKRRYSTIIDMLMFLDKQYET